MGFPVSDNLEALITALFGGLQQSGSLTLHRSPRKSGSTWEDNSLPAGPVLSVLGEE